MSFFTVSKYPPSLLFVLITLGVSLLCTLAYGRTPLFTSVLHIYAVHGSAILAVLYPQRAGSRT